MSLQPLLDASPIIQLHAYAATLAFFIGALVLFRRKGDRAHRRWGMSWVGLMVIVALTSFFIWELRVFGLFSPIHILSVITVVSLFQAVQQARKRNIKAHMRTMQALYLLALVLTGWFTFMPGRIMNRVVFGEGGGAPLESALFLLSSFAIGAGAIWLVRRAGAKRLIPTAR
jgi:Predicted membrane protein